MKKGVIMDMNESFLTLLTPEGEFLRAKKQDIAYSIGEEIYFFPILDSAQRKWLVSVKNIFKLKSIWKPVIALILFISAVIPIYQSNQAYAYMSIDAESSIELGLNKKMQVVEINGFNDETEKIIADLENWKKLDASEITKILITKLKEEGIIAAEEPVIISTVKTKQLDQKVETRLEQNLEEIKQSAVDQKIKINEYTTTKEELEKALASGVSVGKYHKRKNDSNQKQWSKDKSDTDRFGKKQNQKVPTAPSSPEVTNQNDGNKDWESENKFKGNQKEENVNVPKVPQEEREKGRDQWREDRQNQKEEKRLNQNQDQSQVQRQQQRQQENRSPQGQNKKNEQQSRVNENNNNNKQSNDKNRNKHD